MHNLIPFFRDSLEVYKDMIFLFTLLAYLYAVHIHLIFFIIVIIYKSTHRPLNINGHIPVSFDIDRNVQLKVIWARKHIFHLTIKDEMTSTETNYCSKSYGAFLQA